MPAPDNVREPAERWTRWQAAQLAQHTLTPAAAARQYTSIKVRRSLRPAFFAVVDLLSARVRWEDQAQTRPETEVQAAWHAWQTWTRRFAASLDRVATGRAGTLPPVPEALVALLEPREVQDGP